MVRVKSHVRETRLAHLTKAQTLRQFAARTMKELSAILHHLTASGARDAVLATLVAVEGSSYRRPGARLLVTDDGRIGSISGGCLEEDVLTRARKVMATGKPELVVYDTTSENDLVWGVGLGCHGVVHVLLEKVSPGAAWIRALTENLSRRLPTELAVVWRSERIDDLGTRVAAGKSVVAPGTTVFRQQVSPAAALVVFGAGDDAQPLVRMAKELGWHVTVADPRPAFATRERFAGADNLVVGTAETLVARVAPESSALAVVMTHHYVHDRPILRDLLNRPLAYLGLLGPKKRADKILADLVADGGLDTAAARRRLHAPVGLDLGADAPEEVALAIVSEMQATLAGRDGTPLRNRTRPIHE